MEFMCQTEVLAYFKMYLFIFSKYRRQFMCYAKYNDVDTYVEEGFSQIQTSFEPHFKMYLCIFSNYRREFMCYAKYNDVDTWRRGSGSGAKVSTKAV